MYSQCPECLTIYRLSAVHLVAGYGQVQCGHCDARFDALATLCDKLPEQPDFETLDRNQPGSQAPRLTVPAMRPRPEQPMLFDTPDPPRTHRPIRARQAEAATPRFARGAERNPFHTSVWWYVGVLMLALVLAGQSAWVYRDKLLEDATVRPWLDRICSGLYCRLPLRSAPSELRVLSRDIRPHSAVPGALIISASLRNGADFTQSYPVVEITLSDLNGNRVAMRRFQPEEYVSDPSRIEAGLPAGAVNSLIFEVEDPGRDAVAFEFRFL